jgi:DNA invertase Pin-like site-specific DNA recombinase
MKIGYARISNQNQDTGAQVTALSKAGCEKVYEETAGGTKAERPLLATVLKSLCKAPICRTV